FDRSTVKAGVYIRGLLMLLIWVNDILLIGNANNVKSARSELKKELNIKDMGVVRDGMFFGMTVRRDREKRKIYLAKGVISAGSWRGLEWKRRMGSEPQSNLA